ncbi:superfamily II DNA or RNA helicase [Rhodoferax ferrireducens]|uniref:Superfamily II DNA or RNA helicase n=1 Tax=Rhodoferax ferrireducens TaxID=192843 RepID=A0ABU2CEY3_9BURK|nr:DEAD/DEAH box helicase [Rhodoferax ferrireducens]MDR7379868.1 superfamily II DNA or RNA helicase [Rhodoferax ferrireducens]
MATVGGLWFNPRNLGNYVSNAVLERGLTLYRGQKVLDLEVRAIDNGRWQLAGKVQGSERTPYTQNIRLHINVHGMLTHWDADCSCPVGVDCKHAVALSLKAAYRTQATVNAPPRQPTEAELAAARQAAAERARAAAQAKVGHWLAQFDALDRIHHPHPDVERSDYLVYVLGPCAAPHLVRMLELQVYKANRKRNGDWAKPKILQNLPYPGHPLWDEASPQDRELLLLVKGQSVATPSASYGISALVAGAAGRLALQMASDSGRLFALADGGFLGAPLRWAEPLDLAWRWQSSTPEAGEPVWALLPQLGAGRSTAQLYANQPPLYLDAAQGACGLAQTTGIAAEHLPLLLNAPPVPQSALQPFQAPLLRRLGAVALPPTLTPLPCVQGVAPTGHLHLLPMAKKDEAQLGLLRAQLHFDYAGLRGSWDHRETSVLLTHAGSQTLLQRDLDAEARLTSLLLQRGLVGLPASGYGLPGAQSQQPWLDWADSGYAEFRADGFSVTLDDGLTDWLQRADSLDVQMQSAAADPDVSPWFDLSLGMEINGERHNILPWLPSLLAQLANAPVDGDSGERLLPQHVFMRKPDDSFIRVPTAPLRPWLSALLELVGDRKHDLAGDSLRLSRLEALRAGAALGQGAVWTGAQALQELVAQLAGHSALPEVPLPAGVQASLRPYQQQGLNWLQFLRRAGLNGILADDMGLGKTLQTLAHIQVEKDAGRLANPALIIAPVSLMGNWQREAQRFCPGLCCLVLHGADRHEVADSTHAHDVVIAPYSLLQRDRDGWLQAPWHLVVLDEAQNIKNASTQAAQVVGELNTQHRLALSGTPMENHLGEIWSLFHFLMPGFLGSQAQFNTLFRTPIEKAGDSERLAQLRSRITPFMLRRTKALVAHELPPKVETVLRVELAGAQADLYETIRLSTEKAVREALDGKGLAKSHITILDALLKLRQVCCDPQLLGLESARQVQQSAKLEQLMEILPEMLAEGRKVLLFSQFTTMLARIELELKKRGIAWTKLTGQSQKRDQIIDQFTSGAVPLFLISLKAGGVGLNLPQADTVIHYDPWWNPAVETQATDRAHRIGQTQSVWVVKLVAQGTIEERILALQERKAALAESMYSGAQARKEPLFSESDLQELLKPLSN